jgi:hypothetical protein
MSFELVTSEAVLTDVLTEALADVYGQIEPVEVTDAPDLGPRRVPRDIRLWLARLRLLEAVPFSHLVADANLLPVESIRFFHLDRGWTDALVEGALSGGTVTTADRAALETLYPVVRDEVDEAERLVRVVGWQPGAEVASGNAGPITGFLLRSRMVSGWPALHVRAYGRDNLAVNPPIADRDVDTGDDDVLRKLPLLRMERLAPAVLLVLIDGLPRVVHVEEPRAGVQYGVDQRAVAGGIEARVSLRDVLTGKPLLTGNPADPVRSVAVPFRRDAPGVLHVATLAQRIAAVPQTNVGEDVQAGELGIELLQFPWRAVFGDQTLSEPNAAVVDLDAVFHPTVSFEALQVSFAEGVFR